MGQTRAGRRALVDQRVDIGEALRMRHFPPRLPGLCDRSDLVVAQFGERTRVSRRVHDDFLPLEGGVEVRHDAYHPGCDVADAKRLGRCPVLAPLAEGTLVELGLGRRVREPSLRTGTSAPVRRDDDEAPGERVSPKIQSPCCRPVRGTA